jgi:Ca2+-binding RTX toxin-like protein
MFKNQGIVQPLDGKAHETEAVTGGLEPLNPGGQLPVVAGDGLDADAADATDAAVASPEGDLIVAMSALGALPEDQVAGLKTVAATSSSSDSEAGSDVFSSDTQIRQALGIHQASVGSTDFLDRATGDDFGMTEFLESGSFSATPGADLAGRRIEGEVEWEGLAWFRTSSEDDSLLVLGTVDLGDMDEDTSMLITMAGLLAKAYNPTDAPLVVTDLRLADGSGVLTDNGDGTWTFTPAADWNGNVALSYRISDGETSTDANAALTVNPVNDAPVITVNDVLLVDDLTAQSLAGSLSATDVDNDTADLLYSITQSPVSGVLLLDGVEITDFSQPVFTQADIDGGRVTFRFDTSQPGDAVQVIEDDSFVFQVTDGSLNTAETTFHIHNSTVQIWGTNNADDLTGAADFSREGVTFHVYGFDGNDTMRGGSGADTLDGGGHAYAQHSPWLYTQEGGDTVDYGASTAAVDIDLTRAAQTGGHAEGDVLIGIENVVGSGFSDSITGDAAANFLSGLDGNDTLLGGEGNDTLRGGAGADLIDGGVGQDFADYRTSAIWVNVDLNIQDGTTAQSGGGTDNDALGDTLVGIENLIGSNDATHGDVLTGNAASNHLIGLDGDDTLIGNAGNDTFVGGAGADVLSGGTGTRDLADYSGSTAWVNVDLNIQDGVTAQTGGGADNHAEGDILTGIEDVNGSQYSDSLTGNGGSNRIWAYDGNDTVFAGNGADTVHGGDGDDSIDGGGHWDELYGGTGNDTINGGTDIDSIWGGAGDDSLYGGTGDTQDWLSGGAGNDTLDGGSATRWDTLIGGMGADRIIGNGVNSSASYELTGYGDFDVSWQGVYLDLSIQDGVTAQTGKPGGDDATGDILTGIVNAVGTNGHDTLIGNDQDNKLYGVDGNDFLIGGAGNDSLWGVNDNDTLEGGEGADFIWGGLDYDIASYRNAAEGVNVDLRLQLGAQQVGAGEENGDQLWYMDGLWGSEHNDTLTGRDSDDSDYMSVHNVLNGYGGDDILAGLSGNDTLDGGTGTDTANYSLSTSAVNVDLTLSTAQTGGEEGNHARGDVLISIENVTGSAYGDTLVGNGEDNVLSGLDGDDSLVGGGGNDTLIGGAGNDTLQGGAGDDLIMAGAGDVVDGGAGHDVLVSEDEYLDVSSSSAITGIERVDLTGACEGLAVSGDAILSNGVADPAGSGLMALVVTGDVGDSVARLADGGWTWTLVAQEVTIDGTTYVLYEAARDGETVRLYVQTGMEGIEVADGAFQIWGTEGHDDLTTAWNFDDPRYAFHVHGLDGNDTLRGGSGADTLDGGGHAYAAHTPWLYTQEGGDTVDYGASGAAVDVNLTREAQTGGHAEGDVLIGVENVVGSGFDDSITGDAAANLLSGLDGNDTLLGGEGNDTLHGGSGADLIDGGAGQDFADYRTSASWVNVDLTIQDGATAQSGGGVDNDALGDTLVGIESVIGSNDATHGDVLTGNGASNHLIGLDGDDTLIGGAGNDTLVSGAGADRVDGGTGTRDLADYSGSTAWVNVDLTKQDGVTAQTGGGADNHAEGDILTGIEDVNGSAFADSILGNAAANVLYGYAGDDTIFGGGSYDTIHGGDGDDWIDGGSHEDSLFGGAGNDTINGGTGIDSIWGGAGDDYLYGGTGDTQDLLIGGVGNDTLDGGSATRWDTLIGGMGADRIIGNGVNSSASYELTGYGDFDVSYQGVYLDLRLQGPDADGNLMVQTGKPGGDDATGDILTGIVNAVGTNGHDTLIGNDQNNEMYGVDGNDFLIGGAGNDSLWGVNDNDTLEGGEGADFIWGGLDYDIASYRNAAEGVNVDLRLQLGVQQVGAGEENGDQLWYMDGLWGSEHNDTLTGHDSDVPEYMSVHNVLNGYGGDDLISGLSGNDTLDGGTGNDTLIGGLGDDLLLGGEGDDLFIGGISDIVDGGDGFDTFRLEDNIGLGSTFDLSAMNDAGRITGIERIDITGDADDVNTLTLRAEDVFEVSGGSLYVDGDAGDSVTTMGEGWTQEAADVSHEGQTYHHYTAQYDSQTINLYVETTLAYQNEI